MAAKTCKVMDLVIHGQHYMCIKHLDTDRNPFWLYELFWKWDDHSFPRESKKLLVKYEDMGSVLFRLLQLRGYNV